MEIKNQKLGFCRGDLDLFDDTNLGQQVLAIIVDLLTKAQKCVQKPYFLLSD